MPELRQLRAFVAVAEELNFTRAAERLHLRQQAVSKSVQQLERELAVELLERTTREVSLTPAGAELLAAGRDALAATDAAFERARTIGRGLAGTVRVGVSPAVGPSVRDEVVRVLRHSAPDLHVSLHELRPADVAPALRDRDVELVLARTATDAPDVDSASLRPSRVVLCAPAGHWLASESTVRLAELDGERLLTWSAPGTPYTDLLLNRLAAAGAHVEPVQAHVTGATDLSELARSDAVALMPDGWPEHDGIVQLTVEDDVSLPLLVLWPVGAPSPAVRRVRERMSTPS